MSVHLTGAVVRELQRELVQLGFGFVSEWAEGCCPPGSDWEFARELIFVVCNSGMKNSVARGIFERVMLRLNAGLPVGQWVGEEKPAFRHPGKVAAIERMWRVRADLFEAYNACDSDDDRLEFLGSLPWIGSITKYHAARNFGVDCVKPDRHIERLAAHHRETPTGMCARIAGELGVRVGTVDAILWRACAEGLLDSRSGERRPLAEVLKRKTVTKHEPRRPEATLKGPTA